MASRVLLSAGMGSDWLRRDIGPHGGRDDQAQRYPGRIMMLARVEVTTAHGHLLVYFAPDAVDKLQTLFVRIEILKAGTNESHTSKSMADVIAEAGRLEATSARCTVRE